MRPSPPRADSQKPIAGSGDTSGANVSSLRRERIISGDFRMLHAPSEPPELRELREGDRYEGFFAVEIEFHLIALSTEVAGSADAP